MSCRFGLRRRRREQIPGQQFADPVDRMIGDAPQHLGHVSLRIDPVQFRRSQQTVDCRSPFTTGVGPREQIVFTAHGHGTQCTFRRVVIHFHAAVFENSMSAVQRSSA